MAKILCTVTNDLNHDQRMHRICNELYVAGHEIVLIGRLKSDSIPLEEKSFQQKRLSCFFEKGKGFYIEYNFRLLLYLLFNKFDIIHSVDLDTLVPTFVVSKLKRKKLVFDSHEMFTELPELDGRGLTKKIWEGIEKNIVPTIKYGLTVNDSLANYFLKKYQVKFIGVLNVPPKIICTEKEICRDKFILYQGAVNKGRGLNELIRSLVNIDIKLVVAGEGDEFEDLKKLVTDLQLTDRIEFLGFVSPKELIEITSKAFIGVNLLESKSLNYYYSLANKFFDYVHAGVPQLTMNFPEYSKVNKEFEVAYLVDDLSGSSIENGIRKLMVDNDYYIELKQNTEKCKDVYNWENEKLKLLKFYERVILNK
jgi:glycosyltransferase involved in cell wall biosynthesis